MSWSSIKKSCKPLHEKDDVDYKTGCMRKRRFPNEQAAKKAIIKLNKKSDKQFNSYRCRFCKELHIGSYNEAFK